MERLFFFLSLLAGCASAIAGWYYDGRGFDPMRKDHWSWLLEFVKAEGQLPPGYLFWVFVGTGIAFILMILSAIVFKRASSSTKYGGFDKKALHGSARFATKTDIKQARLFQKGSGIVVGGFKTGWFRIRELVYQGGEHVLAFCPTGTGKGVSLVLPTLFRWTGSTIVLDIKEENWALTSGFRKLLGQKVLKFSPTALQPCTRFNPLQDIRIDTDYEIMDAQNVADMIINPDGQTPSGKDSFWRDAGQEWLTACILHSIHRVRKDQDRPANLRDVSLMMSGAWLGITDLDDVNEEGGYLADVCQEMLDFDHGNRFANDEVQRVAREMARRAAKAQSEGSGVNSTVTTKLAIYADPIIARNTAVSDFAIDDLMKGDSATSLYLCLPPGQIDRLRPVIRLIANQILRRVLPDMEFVNGRSVGGADHKMLMLLDELTSLGKLEVFEQALPYLRGYGIQVFALVQDLQQLQKHYGRENAIMGNSDVRVAFTPNDKDTANILSDMIGKTTIVQAKTSISKKAGDVHGQKSTSLSETARPLMMPDELMRMQKIDNGKPGKSLTFIGGKPPVFGDQALYFLDKSLSARAKLPPVFDAAGKVEAADPAEGRNDSLDHILDQGPAVRMAAAAAKAQTAPPPDRYRQVLAEKMEAASD